MKISLFSNESPGLSRPPTTIYLAKLSVVRKKRFCPGIGDYRDGLAFKSWEESVSSSLIESKVRATELPEQGSEITVDDVPAIALGNWEATLLLADFEGNWRLPELSMACSLHDIAAQVSAFSDMPIAWVSEPDFPVAEFPFRTTWVRGKLEKAKTQMDGREGEVSINAAIANLAKYSHKLQTKN